MATKRYIVTPGSSEDTATPISPTPAAWNKTSGSDTVRAISTAPTASGTGTIDIVGTGSNPNDVLFFQCVDTTLYAPQAIGGFFKAVFRTREFNAGTNARAQLVVRAFAMNGVTVLATLVDFDTSALSNEFVNGAAETRRFPLNYTGSGIAVSATITKPFYIVSEFGARVHSTDTANNVRLLVSDNPSGAPDSSETEGSTTSPSNPWWEFSQTLATYSPRNRYVTVQDVGMGSL